MAAPDTVSQLVERFHDNREGLKRSAYGETEVRVQFINPLFEALGWDVRNTGGRALGDMEVVHEDAVKVGMAHKAPDYGFYAGRERKFFVEAKKPSVNLKQNPEPAFQLRRYAWSARLPVSVLTDFEELAIYDTRVQPAQNDQASVARLRHITYDTFVERWDEIAGLFSREAVYEGSIDRWVDKQSSPRGKDTVDRAFLSEIERWRERLAQSIALHNPELTQRELNYAVQMTVDRILFLRMAEDRQIEQYGRLLALTNGGDIHARLQALFREADERYNSGLFHFHPERGRPEQPDVVTPGLTIDDRTLRDIFRNLYYPNSPYEFSVLPVDVLGQVYEQFLGKVITLTSRRSVEIEEKPEVRKAGGVYYTPTYIVDYIVEHTVGKLLEGKTPRQAEKLKILDPACGSGSFLIGAYQYLLTWHRGRYLADGPAKHAKKLYQTVGGEWRLTTDERKRILRNNIHGVDIDPQAVEVTKLSLMLKLLEGETSQTLNRQLSFLRERVLPDMGANIKCGNSLIGPDFYDNQQMTLLPAEDQYRINVFDWKSGFPDVFSGNDPGFDAVIGNPPYIRIQALKEWAPVEIEHYKRAYQAARKGNYDIYVVFVERGLELLNGQGRLGYILPHKFFNSSSGEPLRLLISQGDYLTEVVHFGDQQVFAGATTYTCLMFLDARGVDDFRITKVDDLSSWRLGDKEYDQLLPATKVTDSDWNFVIGPTKAVIDRLELIATTVGDFAARIAQGIRTSGNEVYVLDEVRREGPLIWAFSKALNRNVIVEEGSVLPFLQGREIKAYRISSSGKIVILPYEMENGRVKFIPEERFRELFPHTHAYLVENKEFLQGRERGRMRTADWYAYVYPKNLEVMLSPKILVPDIADRAAFALDSQGIWSFTSGYGLILRQDVRESPHYALGLLNSSLIDLYLKSISTTLRGGFFRYFTQYIEQLPIRTIDFTNPADVTLHDQMVSLVERMLALNEQARAARTGHDRTILQRQIEGTDRRIDRLVYQLYGLTDDEIAIVEAETAVGTRA